VSDPILLAMLRQLLRQGVLSDMDIQAMMADLESDGHASAAYSVAAAYVEACAMETASIEAKAIDGGNALD
jgi:hypothetical protein